MSARDLVTRVAVLKWLKDAISEEELRFKPLVVEALGPGGRQYALASDGREVATVSVSRPKPDEVKTVVTDERALAAWLAGEVPEAVQMVPAPWWVDNDLPRWIEAHGGELPPGVGLVESTTPRMIVRISPKQRAVIEDVLGASGLFDLPGINGLIEGRQA